ncbi:hypothetical protein LCGC14_0318280 [marine sediment metagenome]|uniref:Uncharacterized protein n=1 Tax=marine sediment metagenome TaxID=412755 RepID=A0A0F9TQE4_9ZZZZ
MNLGIRMFAFIQQRDTMITKREKLEAVRYECIVCPTGMGGVYVRFPAKTPKEFFCLGCGQSYLVILAETIE